MSGARWLMAAAFLAVLGGNIAGPAPAEVSIPRGAIPQAIPGALSVMTYNVAGLPFPVALNRTSSLQEIGLRLANLREQGTQPHVVLLQEAFTPEAKSIATLAGYRYVAFGPAAADANDTDRTAMPGVFRSAASFIKGETIGKWQDSGLVVLSDFPIVRTAKMAFAPDACAGYDCLAAKGVLVTWIRVPGASKPVAIANTHLNSRKATGVSIARADMAYAEQCREVRAFLGRTVDRDTALVFGGDFNIGHFANRIALTTGPAPLVPGGQEVIAQEAGVAPPRPLNADLKSVIKRGKDKQFYRPASGTSLTLTDVRVPFGSTAGGFKLSDHLGYVADYRVGPIR